jgi:hypothetical protein
MALSQDLEQLIRSSVHLGQAKSNGFEQCKCADCNDYKERGGFKFEGNSIIFSCFNCGLKAVFNNDESKRPSNKFIALLAAFGIPTDVVKALVAKHIISIGSTPQAKKAALDVAAELEKWAPPKTIDAPEGELISIEANGSPWCEVARAYIESRGLTSHDYQFYVTDSKRYEGRLLIPFWHDGRLTYWQARSLDDSCIFPRYLNPTADKNKIIFNYDELLTGPSVEPLFISEGALDSISIGKRGAALNGSSISDWQLAELKKVARRGRKLIFVIDKNENGYNLGMKMLSEGWHVAVLPDGVDDANQGRVRFGKLWLLNHLATTSVSGLAGRLLLAAKCVRKKN